MTRSATRKARPKNPSLSTYMGKDTAGGPANPVKAVLARREVVADLKVRFRLLEQTEFIKEAATKTNPPESLNLFLATAALERAARLLGRNAPVPET